MRPLIRNLKDSRLFRVLVGGSAVVGVGAAAGTAVGHQGSSDAPPDDVSLGPTTTTVDVEGEPVVVPTDSTLPPDTMVEPVDAPDSTPNSVVDTVDTTGTAPSANTLDTPGTPDTPDGIDNSGPGNAEDGADTPDDIDNSGPSENSGPGNVEDGDDGPDTPDDDGGDNSGPGGGDD